MLGSGTSAASGCGPTLMTAMTLGLTVAFFRQSLLHEGTPQKQRAGVPSSSRLQASHTILNICSSPGPSKTRLLQGEALPGMFGNNFKPPLIFGSAKFAVKLKVGKGHFKSEPFSRKMPNHGMV